VEKIEEVTWPYSTHDEVSHLAVEDVKVLRARIDMLLEERRLSRRRSGFAESVAADRWSLSAQESRLVEALLAVPIGMVCTKDQVYEAVVRSDQTADEAPAPKIVDVLVCKVRKKLAVDGIAITTHWGRGYSLDPNSRARLTA
jgi:two-component system, cell cycle response regulator CtrA